MDQHDSFHRMSRRDVSCRAMGDLILTGASRGIGHALPLALAERHDDRLVLVARDRASALRIISGGSRRTTTTDAPAH